LRKLSGDRGEEREERRERGERREERGERERERREKYMTQEVEVEDMVSSTTTSSYRFPNPTGSESPYPFGGGFQATSGSWTARGLFVWGWVCVSSGL
jgi:hypothetical protein